MFHIVLVSPEIPPNTGNVIRLAANTGAFLHLVRPLGFELDDARLKRAGLDYHEWARMQVHDTLVAALAATGTPPIRHFAMTTGRSAAPAQQGGSELVNQVVAPVVEVTPFAGMVLQPGDVFVFGRETAGLSDEELAHFGPGQRLRLPMRPGQRSLNLSNAVAVTVFEAWRQAGYEGAV